MIHLLSLLDRKFIKTIRIGLRLAFANRKWGLSSNVGHNSVLLIIRCMHGLAQRSFGVVTLCLARWSFILWFAVLLSFGVVKLCTGADSHIQIAEQNQQTIRPK